MQAAAVQKRRKRPVNAVVFHCMRRVLLLSAAVALASCALGPEARITVLLPPLPGPWRAAFPVMQCLLSWFDGSGAPRSTLLGGWESGAVVCCAKEGNTPVLAWPISSLDPEAVPVGRGPGSLRPAGGMYPGSLVDQRAGTAVQLTWEAGAAASVLGLLRSLGRDTSLFNAERLSGELGAAPDPWDLDLPAVAEAIARGDFSVYDVERLPCRDVRVEAGQGDWLLESPFRNVLRAEADGALLLPCMALGTHSLFSVDGRCIRISVQERVTAAIRVR